MRYVSIRKLSTTPKVSEVGAEIRSCLCALQQHMAPQTDNVSRKDRLLHAGGLETRWRAMLDIECDVRGRRVMDIGHLGEGGVPKVA